RRACTLPCDVASSHSSPARRPGVDTLLAKNTDPPCVHRQVVRAVEWLPRSAFQTTVCAHGVFHHQTLPARESLASFARAAIVSGQRGSWRRKKPTATFRAAPA